MQRRALCVHAKKTAPFALHITASIEPNWAGPADAARAIRRRVAGSPKPLPRRERTTPRHWKLNVLVWRSFVGEAIVRLCRRGGGGGCFQGRGRRRRRISGK